MLNDVILPDGRLVHRTVYLMDAAGYVNDPLFAAAARSTAVSDAIAPTPAWYYRARYNPGQTRSFVDPIIYSLLPTIHTIEHDPFEF